METLVEFLPILRSLGEREAIRYSNGVRSWTWSYAGLHERITATAAFLEDRLGKGDRVILWSENRPEWVVVFWAAIARGVVVVPIDAHASAGRVQGVRAESGARLVIHGAAAPPGGIESFPIDKVGELPRTARLESEPVAGSDIAEMLYTSGTTAAPKGMAHRHRNLCANLTPIAREIARYRHWARPFQPIRFLNIVPLSHMFGQTMGMFIPPLVGGSAVFMAGLHPGAILDTIRSERVSVLVAVPRILDGLRGEVERRHPETRVPADGNPGVAKRWWRYRRVHSALGWKFWSFVVGGARLDEGLEAFWSRLGLLVVQGYGLTETSAVVAVNHPFHARRGTLGTGLAAQEIRLAEDGEILVRGPSVVEEYVGPDAGALPTTDEDGWFHTGDLGERDAEGRLIYRGRKKDVIVTSEGLNVYPEDVESVLDRMPGVRESAVVAVGTPRGEVPHAVLVLDPGVDPVQVIEDANRRLEPEQRFRSWSVWPGEGLPRTASTGKLQRQRVREAVATGSGSSGAVPARGSSSFLDVLAEATGLPPERLAPERTVDEDLGLSSLERVELLAALEARYGVGIDEQDFAGLRTIGEIEQHVGQRRSSRPAASPLSQAAPGAPRMGPPRWARIAAVRAVGRTIVAVLVFPILRCFVRVRTVGLERLDTWTPPVLFAATHTSHMDVAVILRALPGNWRRRIAPAAAQEHFFPREGTRPEPRWLLRLEYLLACIVFNIYPLPQRMGQVRDSLRYSGELAGAGYCPLVFPEGKRTEDGRISPFRSGVGYMAAHLGVPVVPLRIEGLFEVFPIGARWPRRGGVTVRIGEPLRHEEAESYDAFARRLEDAVRRMGEQNAPVIASSLTRDYDGNENDR